MDLILLALGLLGLIGFLVVLVVSIIRKTSKKTALIGMGVCFVVFVIGIAMPSPDTQGKQGIESNIDEAGITNIQDTTQDEIDETETVPINFEDIQPEITILEPDSIGSVYMEATYTNNSDYPITGYSLTVLLKDKNEKTYLMTYDTVMPGETSPKFDSFGPETRNPNDYEMLKLEVTAKTEEGNELYIEYDLKLGEATWRERK